MQIHTHIIKHNIAIAAFIAIGIANSPALAGVNDFFGGSVPPGAIGAPVDDLPTSQSPRSTSTDFTDDEKRMRKKYRVNMNRARQLIAKGDQMMKEADPKNDKDLKKGKILKEIGEKQLAELKANSPFIEDKERNIDKPVVQK